MNIEDMIYNGASEEEVAAALNAIYDEKRKQEEALRAKEQAQKENKEKEALKAEGRAYLINALIAYSEAFDLLDEGETWDEEDVAKAEEAIKKIEEMVPMYIKLVEMQSDLDKKFGLEVDPDSFFKGLF
jgi:hypothetical protein